jgi:hypothetical protein
MTLTTDPWKELVERIVNQNCTPFIGPEILGETIQQQQQLKGKSLHPLASAFEESYKEYPLASAFEEFAKLAKDKYGYPLEHSYYLARLAQSLAISSQDEVFPKIIFSKKFKDIKAPDFSLEENRNTPYAVLADLKLPIYITTNYDYFMEEALASKGLSPVTEFCRWSDLLGKYAIEAGYTSVFDKKYEPNEIIKYIPTAKPYKPTPAQPLVYHLHGVIDIPQSMVLTEKDYIDFVMSINVDRDKRLPNEIIRALVRTLILFIGYRLEDITFRVIFQGVISSSSRCMALQLPTSFPKDSQEKVQKYFTSYIKNMYHSATFCFNLDYFSKHLREQVDKYRESHGY